VKVPTIKITPLSDHGSEIGLLAVVAIGVMVLMGLNAQWAAQAKQSFDPSAYLVVLTLIVGAIKERWTQRSVDRMGQSLANAPPAEPPAQGTP
jgi:cation transport ATPase